jgi:hypothetical protein
MTLFDFIYSSLMRVRYGADSGFITFSAIKKLTCFVVLIFSYYKVIKDVSTYIFKTIIMNR